MLPAMIVTGNFKNTTANQCAGTTLKGTSWEVTSFDRVGP